LFDVLANLRSVVRTLGTSVKANSKHLSKQGLARCFIFKTWS